MEVETINAIVGFVLFNPLLFIAGFYGITVKGRKRGNWKSLNNL